MVLTRSTMLTLGTTPPPFNLPDVQTGDSFSTREMEIGKAFLVMFICRHCPYVQHIKYELAKIGDDYRGKDITIVAISSNDADNYPEDSVESLKAFAKEMEFAYPLLYDETQDVAKAYTAACTPDFFLFNKDQKLAYRGQLDDSRPGNAAEVTGKDLRGAIDAVLHDHPVPNDQKPSSGCNIKWKRGNEPSYFA